MRLWGYLATFAGAIIGCILIVVAVFLFTDNQIIPGILAVLLGVGVFTAGIMYQLRVGKMGRAEFLKAAETGFIADHQGWYEGTGIAADITGGKLLLGDEHGQTIVPFAEIAQFRFVPKPVRYYGSSQNIIGLIFLITSLAGEIRDIQATGLFVSTTGGRTYRVIGLKEADGQRWLKLLEDIKAGRAEPSMLMRLRPLDSAR